MNAVHFGAGNIGRGFIGPMLSRSGYRVCFVGRNKQKISRLQEQGQYPLTLANENRDSYMINNVTALHLDHTEEVAHAIAEAEIVTTAVGISALDDISGTIARGIELRLCNSNLKPLHVIACENGINSSGRLKNSVYAHMKRSFQEMADISIAFPNVMIDRIVPVQQHKDPLEILVEPFSEWVIPREDLLEDHIEIEGAHYVDSLDPYLKRKLFTVNTGHCSAAYFGYLEGHTSIQEAMEEPGIRSLVRGVLEETGKVLVQLYGLDPQGHQNYIEKIMRRFMNPGLSDSVARVGRSPLRKLASKDRLVLPAMQAHKLGLKTPHLLSAIAAALFFDAPKDPEAQQLQQIIRTQGVREAIAGNLEIPKEHPLHALILAEYNKLCLRYPHMSGSGFAAMKHDLSGLSG
ncbi:mannitol-1-phosphate 5-dehydrogenase [Paenibacillus sp. FSL R7-0331]|uniref:mannitol-1-phosphate 5-dehydrogenase n=1 Tax=Paenibacillus sp. FSL R7-0331 TaxID=1536773 RepID=UPI0004F79037|nr:mannitol-1-phosphate 5-dehydrogenase [Paenibacillus sp. FSL R7-0331]AIQ54949.1 mannitol-1-phosphate 5-dehydrogenase [Paenibacillus sp. FSL R7-0331]